MAYAYYEKIARINLTTGEIKVEKLDVEKAKKFIGGRGLGTKIVYDEASEWTYINIVDDKIELLDAREYLGLFSEDLDEKLKEKHGRDSSVLSIGIAGEKQVLLAAIMNDKDRAAGRSGVGAVMGSKKLKGMTSKLDVTLPDYYKVRGWEAAFPTDETLKRLGLDECIGK